MRTGPRPPPLALLVPLFSGFSGTGLLPFPLQALGFLLP